MKVSILTRSEERVQLFGQAPGVVVQVFQSSPAPRSGCNPTWARPARRSPGFNPHPLRGAGATRPFMSATPIG